MQELLPMTVSTNAISILKFVRLLHLGGEVRREPGDNFIIQQMHLF